MAQLKDLLVNGVSRFVGSIYGSNATFSETVSANKGIFNNQENKGSATKPIYWKDGAPVEITSYEGNANTATGFASAKSITLTGDITGSATGGNGTNGWSIATTIGAGKVTNNMLAGGIANGKLANSKVTIAGNDVSLGGSLSADTLRTSLGLSSAMHFIGIATSDMTDGQTTNPTISGKTSYTPAAGDVVLAKGSASGNNQEVEFVYTGSWWELLGQDSSFALSGHIHGNITNDGKLGIASQIVVTDANKAITTYAINPANIVTAISNANVAVPGTGPADGNNATKSITTYTYAKSAIFTPNGLIMGGTAQNAGLVTRGICGSSTPNATTGAATKDNLYINYDGDNTYRSGRQVILQAGTAGTHYGNNVYQYAAVRGDAMKAWVEAKGYSTTTGTVTSITLKAGTGISLDTDNTAITTFGTRTISLAAVLTDANAKTYGNTSQQTPSHGGTFNIPYFTVDKYGRITAANITTVKLPADNNTDTKVKVTTGTTTKSYLIGATATGYSTGAAIEAIADTGVYLDTTASRLTSGSFAWHVNSTAKAYTQYNSTDDSIEFNFI